MKCYFDFTIIIQYNSHTIQLAFRGILGLFSIVLQIFFFLLYSLLLSNCTDEFDTQAEPKM